MCVCVGGGGGGGIGANSFLLEQAAFLKSLVYIKATRSHKSCFPCKNGGKCIPLKCYDMVSVVVCVNAKLKTWACVNAKLKVSGLCKCETKSLELI